MGLMMMVVSVKVRPSGKPPIENRKRVENHYENGAIRKRGGARFRGCAAAMFLRQPIEPWTVCKFV